MIQTASPLAQTDDPLVRDLQARLGAEGVLTDPASLAFHGQDVYAAGAPLRAVVRPATRDALAQAMAILAAAGVAIVPRGGGMSYSGGYLAPAAGAVLVDTGRLDRIIEINAHDMYVVAEAGVTWAALDAALAPHGLRTPFWGPFSGIRATIGGSLSQNAVTYGTGIHGTAVDSMVGLEVALGDGRLVRTGSWGHGSAGAFFRHFGPDLTGLFGGDAGALGIKTAAAFRLVKRRPVSTGLSFCFQDFNGLLGAMAAVAREGVTSEGFGLDPFLQKQRLGMGDLKSDLKMLLAVGKAGRGPVEALWQMAKIAIAGRGFLKDVNYSAHYTVDAADRDEERSMLRRVRAAAQPFGREIENSMPTLVRAYPFPPLNHIMGPKGERWVPVHGILPFSRVADFREALEGLYAGQAEAMARHKVQVAAMFSTVSTNAFLYEIAIYWEEARAVFHDRVLEPSAAASLARYPANPEGTELVEALKADIVALFHRHGAAHLQVGRLYPLSQDRDPAATELLEAVKRWADPRGIVNPGALGL
ncbi:FAD-binding oxidoreductase [Nitrospirillum iridis]|uniref:FAD/FMN-containing dehydrogenase n=1 Tax=Nitrospirillum iridis TaxID=765888 RepID=A0A7X0AZW1_9PROT|nr:FAD-binding oxidoreductase [Nitrospirillum iridis]MBB6253100.1 FAD/FMN-containing dehydrogenase [Nitrospirillum iridis]